jgi:hypothetical protein
VDGRKGMRCRACGAGHAVQGRASNLPSKRLLRSGIGCTTRSVLTCASVRSTLKTPV